MLVVWSRCFAFCCLLIWVFAFGICFELGLVGFVLGLTLLLGCWVYLWWVLFCLGLGLWLLAADLILVV